MENTADGAAGLSTLPGRRIMSAKRHGKQLVLPLDRGVLGLHMGMTGRLVILEPDDEPLRYTRYTFTLNDGRRIELDDVRRWAGAVLVDSEDELTVRLGPDAIDPAFTSEMFVERITGRRSAIKPLLMDQSVLAGVGNIYADEALHRSGISPARRAHRISRARLARLHGRPDGRPQRGHRFSSPPILTSTARRTSSTPTMVACASPENAAHCARPAPEPIRSRKLGGRTAHYCPRCQH